MAAAILGLVWVQAGARSGGLPVEITSANWPEAAVLASEEKLRSGRTPEVVVEVARQLLTLEEQGLPWVGEIVGLAMNQLSLLRGEEARLDPVLRARVRDLEEGMRAAMVYLRLDGLLPVYRGYDISALPVVLHRGLGLVAGERS